jgi:hypothetical protein
MHECVHAAARGSMPFTSSIGSRMQAAARRDMGYAQWAVYQRPWEGRALQEHCSVRTKLMWWLD